MPILPPETLVDYYKALPFLTNAVKLDNNKALEFPSSLADRFGWNHLVAVIAKVYRSLPEMDRKQCGIICHNYSQAGAVDLFGGPYHLPKAICGHLTYYIWGPGAFNGEIAIVTGIDEAILKRLFRTVELTAIINSKYASSFENNLHVYVCRNLKMPVKVAWRRFKNY